MASEQSLTVPETPVIDIRPAKGWIPLNLRELWAYRELLFFLVWRDVKVRYRQTLLGFAWAILNPVVSTVVFTLIFGKVAKLSTDGLPPEIFYMMGLTIWRYFAASLGSASSSLVGSAGLLTKIYFPRILIPMGSCLNNLVDFAVAFSMLIALMLYFHTVPALTSLFFPVLVLIAMTTALGVGLFFAALNVRYRDVDQLVPFLLQLWMYASVVIPFSKIPADWGIWRYAYGINPMAGVIEGFRWCLAHHVMAAEVEAPWILVLVGLPFALGSLVFGLYYFRRVEKLFADIV